MDATALYKFQSGLYVISAESATEHGACLINTGLQLTSEPLKIQAVVNKQNFTEHIIEEAGHFALTILTEEATMPYIGRFGFRTSENFDKFGAEEPARTVLGDPYEPASAAAVIACEVEGTLDVGTHMLFVGRVVDAQLLSEATPMTYAYYHTVLKGKTPPKASSYVAE